MDVPEELWTSFHMLDPGQWPEFLTYANRYCAPFMQTIRTKYGTTTKLNTRGAARLDELQEVARSRYVIRRLKSQVLKDLPAKTRQIIYLAGVGIGKYLREERSAFDGMASQVGASMAMEMIKGNNLVDFPEMGKARLALARAKAKLCVQHIRDVLDSEPAVVVFAHHVEMVDELMTAMAEFRPVRIVGGMTEAAKQKSVDTFMGAGSGCRILVGNIQAAGTGYTLTRARVAIFAELVWSASALTQAEDRIHRISQVSNVLIQYLVVDGSLDGNMIHNITTKLEVANAALDDRG
jgi:SWI/SNF-related matrix-associated actin-dependent regulator 1 of chromatin subfamily A